MWNLVRLSLAYHLKAVFWTMVIALLLSKHGLGVAAIVGVVLLMAEDKERRLLLQLPLPVTRIQVGWSRVVFSAMILILATAATLAPVSIAVLVGASARPFPEKAAELLFFAIGMMFILQLLLAARELEVWAGGRFLHTLIGGTALVLLLSISILAWIALAQFGSSVVVALGTAGLTLGLMGLTVFLFGRRPSYVSG